MKRILLSLLALAVLFLLSASAALAFGWKDVIQMHEDGIADSLIIQKIEYSGETFHLNAKELRALKRAGVSDEVISAMLRTEAEDEYTDDREDGYGYYPHTRIYAGFCLGYYDPWIPYYGGSGYRWHRPYYGSYRYWRYPYRRHYVYRGYTGYRVPDGQWGDTRYRGQVGERIDTGNRRYTGYRERARVAPPHGGRARSR